MLLPLLRGCFLIIAVAEDKHASVACIIETITGNARAMRGMGLWVLLGKWKRATLVAFAERILHFVQHAPRQQFPFPEEGPSSPSGPHSWQGPAPAGAAACVACLLTWVGWGRQNKQVPEIWRSDKARLRQ